MDPRDEAVLGLLQAYVDDALPPAEAARLRAEIDADPALRRAERDLRALSDEISIFVALGGFPPPGAGGGGAPRRPDAPPAGPAPVVGGGVRPVVRVGATPGVRPAARPRRALTTPAAWLTGAVVLACVGTLAVVALRTRTRPSPVPNVAPPDTTVPDTTVPDTTVPNVERRAARPSPTPPRVAPPAESAPAVLRPRMTVAIDGAERIRTRIRKSGYAGSDSYRLSDGGVVRLDFDTAPLPPLPDGRAAPGLSMDPGAAAPVRRTPSMAFDTLGLFVRVSGDVGRSALDQARAHVVVRAP